MILLTAGLVSLLLTGAFVQLAKSQGWGKVVRDSGPSSHLSKQGTPTMGGAAFLLAALVVTLAFTGFTMQNVALVLLVAAAGALGLYDDVSSLQRKRRQAQGPAVGEKPQKDAATGLLARYRILGHLIIGFGFSLWAVNAGYRVTDAAWFDLLLYAVAIAGSINAFNFTDGLDGLAAGVTVIVLLFLLGSPLATALMGALLAFLWYNSHPARVIMGGVGSEAIGAAVAGLAIVDGSVPLLPLIALIPVLEVLSVIVQVTYFKATGGKRLLKMSPLHHHFELVGLSEVKIVVRFWIFTGLCVVAALVISGRVQW